MKKVQFIKRVKLLSVALILAIFMTNCEKDNANDFVQEENSQSINWETTDPDVIRSISEEIESSIKSKRLQVEVYRNFRLYVDQNTPRDIINIAKGEIDQVYSVGLKSTTVRRMNNVRSIHLAPTGQTGLFYYNRRIVINDYDTYRRVARGEGNVAFHELVHYYHDVYIPGGFRNRQLTNLYYNARSRNIYPRQAYVMSNVVEYLGVSAEAYFTGTGREPYNRARVNRLDPDLAAYISNNF
ncbi:hypothetical protein [Aquimarina sp. AU58]|uniref:hypothetical protein n=1 Tax=Aquimarina sp. AU58 TaxID=1874112 RepID=UPI001359E5AE|nr:hypothetical protein [Aquimarina sp. AU58]